MAIVGFPSHEYPREEREKDGLIEKKRWRALSSTVWKTRGFGRRDGEVGSHFMVRNYRRGWAEGVWESEFSRGPRAPIDS